MISQLWNAPTQGTPIGTATTGSSEAIHLGGLALKKKWQEQRREKGKPEGSPNIIMGAHAQVALHKFARYFDVEARVLPISPETGFCIDPAMIKEHVDENTSECRLKKTTQLFTRCP
jgi:glutamate decarboxylase